MARALVEATPKLLQSCCWGPERAAVVEVGCSAAAAGVAAGWKLGGRRFLLGVGSSFVACGGWAGARSVTAPIQSDVTRLALVCSSPIGSSRLPGSCRRGRCINCNR